MFVDYSGLQRFSFINKCFARNFLQLLEYECFNSIEKKLEYFKSFEKEEICVQKLEVGDLESHANALDYLFKISLSIKQMQDVSEVVKRCPTVYAVELFDAEKVSLDTNDVVVRAGISLRETYDDLRTELCDAIKRKIVEWKPKVESVPFQDWQLLQKYLFYSYCVDVPKFMAPKTEIVIIPMNFPKAYVGKVNKNGFMKADASINFFLFGLEGEQDSLSDFDKNSLILRPIKNKISTIWKDGDEKDYIGTEWEPLESRKIEMQSQRTRTGQPNFVTLFCHNDDNEAGCALHSSPNKSTHHHQHHHHKNLESINSGSMESESSFVTDKRSAYSGGSIYDIFSPLSSNELPTALTPPNNPTNSPTNGKGFDFQKFKVYDKSSSDNFAPLPPPPSFLPCYSDFESFSLNGEKLGLKYKLKRFFSSSSFCQKSRSANTSSAGFETVGSWAEFQGSAWNDMSTKKFITFKLKKLKRSYRSYKEVAKQCIEDFHDSSNC